MTKKDKLITFFKEDQDAQEFYKKELESYKKAVAEYGNTYYNNFGFWLEHISMSYDVLKKSISYAGYKHYNSDRVFLIAIKELSSVGMELV